MQLDGFAAASATQPWGCAPARQRLQRDFDRHTAQHARRSYSRAIVVPKERDPSRGSAYSSTLANPVRESKTPAEVSQLRSLKTRGPAAFAIDPAIARDRAEAAT